MSNFTLSLILGGFAALADIFGGLVLVRSNMSKATCAISSLWARDS